MCATRCVALALDPSRRVYPLARQRLRIPRCSLVSCEEKFAALCRTADGGVKPLRRKDGHLAEDHALEQAYASRKVLERAPGISPGPCPGGPESAETQPGRASHRRGCARGAAEMPNQMLHLRRSLHILSQRGCVRRLHGFVRVSIFSANLLTLPSSFRHKARAFPFHRTNEQPRLLRGIRTFCLANALSLRSRRPSRPQGSSTLAGCGSVP